MSQWTHVQGIVRFDTYRLSYAELKLILRDRWGPTWTFDDPKNEPFCHAPAGSEGSIRYTIVRGGHCGSSTNPEKEFQGADIIVVGDLRDFDSPKRIMDWIRNVTSGFSVEYHTRSGLVHIDVEGGEKEIWIAEGLEGEWRMVWKEDESPET